MQTNSYNRYIFPILTTNKSVGYYSADVIPFGVYPELSTKLPDRNRLRLRLRLAARGQPFGDELVVLLGGFGQAGFAEINRPAIDADEGLAGGLVGTQVRNFRLFCRVHNQLLHKNE